MAIEWRVKRSTISSRPERTRMFSTTKAITIKNIKKMSFNTPFLFFSFKKTTKPCKINAPDSRDNANVSKGWNLRNSCSNSAERRGKISSIINKNIKANYRNLWKRRDAKSLWTEIGVTTLHRDTILSLILSNTTLKIHTCSKEWQNGKQIDSILLSA